MENLLADNFSGLVQFRLSSITGFFVLRGGGILRALESTSRGHLVARLPARIFALMHQRSNLEVSVFVLSEAMVSVYCSAFAFSSDSERRIERQELQGVLKDLADKEKTGFLRLVGPDGLVYLIIDEGTILTERFAERFGNVICGPAQVNALLDHVHENGSKLQVRAESSDTIAKKTEAVNDDLGRIRQLTLKKVSGLLFRSADGVKLSDDVLKDWELDPKAQFDVELETADGRMFQYKGRAGSSRLGNKVEVNGNMLKDMGVTEGDFVNVRPIL